MSSDRHDFELLERIAGELIDALALGPGVLGTLRSALHEYGERCAERGEYRGIAEGGRLERERVMHVCDAEAADQDIAESRVSRGEGSPLLKPAAAVRRVRAFIERGEHEGGA